LYQHVKDLREDKDLTQQQIAELLNISQTTYSRYEGGVLDIPSSSLISLAKFYKTSVDYLLDLTNNKTPYDK
jgi:Predicted transcriptional regulators